MSKPCVAVVGAGAAGLVAATFASAGGAEVVLLERTRDGGRKILPSDLPVTRAEPLLRELEAFVASCRGEQAPLVTGAAGRRALETALAVVEAIK